MEPRPPDFDAVISLFTYPPVIRRIAEVYTFPAVVLTRKELGKRYFKSNAFASCLFYLACIPSCTLFPSTAATIVGALVGIPAAIVFRYAYCQRRHEIETREERKLAVHSRFVGEPRFGLPNTERVNYILLPSGMMVAGMILTPLSFGLGMYLFGAGTWFITVGLFRRNIDLRVAADIADMHAPPVPASTATPETVSVIAAAARPRVAAGNPLAGFEKLLSEEQP